MIKGILLCLALLLFGCDAQMQVTSGRNVVASADQQRHTIIERTRAASYSVFADTDDASKLKDETFLEAMHAETARGSAFAVRSDGLVMTNVHVIDGTNFCTGSANTDSENEADVQREAGRLKEETARREHTKETFCLFVTQSFTKVFRAKLVKMDHVNDIALMCLEHPDGLVPYLNLAPPNSYAEGAEVLTIGSPLGNTNMMTHGYISNLDFIPDDKATGTKGVRQIQFSAAILPGNSGGPLVSVATGEVVGQVVALLMMRGIPTQMSYANPVEFLRENIRNAPPCGAQ